MKQAILSPAGSIEALQSAGACGANEIYLGLDRFNARMKAENFTLENLKTWVEYAHLFQCKVFLTLNVSLKESELSEALHLLQQAYLCGIDGAILTDLALIALAAESMPDLYLVASTQLNVCNAEGVAFLRELGIRRVVLSRECTKEDIDRICESGIVDVEIFAQGAMCVCQSGQCLFSSMVAGNSGNRGRCAQPCRKRYVASDTSGKELKRGYLLSMKDLCLLKDLKDFPKVSSFKIEGRNRRAEYVAQATDCYIRTLNGRGSSQDLSLLKRVYNRGDYTKGYAYSFTATDLIDSGIQGHKGERIGTVKAVSGQNVYCSFCSSYQPTEEDAYKIIRGGSEVGNAIFKNGILSYHGSCKKGDGLFITTDQKQLLHLHRISQRIPVDMKLTAVPQQPLCLTVSSGDRRVTVSSEYIVQKAVTDPLTAEAAVDRLSKLNDTPYVARSVQVETNCAYVPNGKLNEIRRNSVRALTDALVKTQDRSFKAVSMPQSLPSEKTQENRSGVAVVSENPETLRALGNRVLKIYAPEDYRTVQCVDSCYLSLPSFASSADLDVLERAWSDSGAVGVVANNVYAIRFAQKHRCKLLLGQGMNIFNSATLNVIRSRCLAECDFVYSLELSGKDIADMENSSGLIYSFGKIELMQLTHCPIQLVKGCDCLHCAYEPIVYTDEKGYRFDLYRTQVSRCYYTLMNRSPLNCSKYLPKNRRYFLNLKYYDRDSCVKIVNSYLQQSFYTEGDYTTGHWNKSVT